MSTATTARPVPDQLEPEYGTKAVAVEPGGANPIPMSERHGRPRQLLWMWTSPNMEFATVFVGAIAVLVFGLSFWQAVAAILLGNGLGALFHGVLTAYVGLLARAFPGLGDLTFEVGIVLAFGLYAVLRPRSSR